MSTTFLRITKLTAPAEVATRLVPPMRNLNAAIAGRMRRIVPKRTWDLHDTITDQGVEVVGSSVVATTSFGGIAPSGRLVNYGLYVERGTSRQAAQPFARPALLQSKAGDFIGGAR